MPANLLSQSHFQRQYALRSGITVLHRTKRAQMTQCVISHSLTELVIWAISDLTARPATETFMTERDNVDPEEIEKFNDLAHRWWDTEGDFKPLHDINPCRLSYIQDKADLAAGPTLDVGCGGGILAESIARLG